MREVFTLEFKGAVHQGGFRPLLWRLFTECEGIVSGTVRNTGEGVEVTVEGVREEVMAFLQELPKRIPYCYHLTALSLVGRQPAGDFDLRRSGIRVTGDGNNIMRVRPDFVPCGDCIREALAPAGRRKGYAFNSCGKCGPAYSIAARSPFLRRDTAFTAFPMCSRCREDYENGNDCHRGGETVVCPDCGPQYFMLDMYGDLIDNVDPLSLARKSIAAGEILALQSVNGGFRLLLDAFNEEKIEHLRRKKKNPDRPLCLLMRNMEAVRRYCYCSEQEETLLRSARGPYVILRRKRDRNGALLLPSNISPDTETLCVGLPESLTETLLFEQFPPDEKLVQPFPEVLINCGDTFLGHAECLDIDEIFNRLMPFTDKFLCHDLRTGHACPHTVCAVQNGVPRIRRRAKGFVPDGLKMPDGCFFRRVTVAFGTDVHAASAIGTDNEIIPSQELENIAGETGIKTLNEVTDSLIDICDAVPQLVVCDMDRSSRTAVFAASYAEKYHLPLITVQTSHAMALACMAEHSLDQTLAIVFSSGHAAPDGTFWGAECIEVHPDSFSRYSSFKGHRTACKKNTEIRPARLALECLAASGVEISGFLLEKLRVSRSESDLWRNASSSDTAETHSAERLFAAVAAVLGFAPDFSSYPGRCRGILENLAQLCTVPDSEIPPEVRELFRFTAKEEDDCLLIDWDEMLRTLARIPLIDEDRKPLYARSFYLVLSDVVLEMACYASKFTEERRIVLSGEVFMDSVLSVLCIEKLTLHGFMVFQHEKTSPNESSACIGQAYAALMA